MTKILLVEDDKSLINGLVFALQKAEYNVSVAPTKESAFEKWESDTFDLAILDVNLPDGNGYEICKEIRRTSVIPILFLTALDDEINITMGLDIGGDDYISKPFKLSVLLSRINALLRRSTDYNHNQNEIVSGNIKIIPTENAVYNRNEKIDLTANEYKLLKYFIDNQNIVLSAEQILSALWDCDEKFVDANTLTVYIRRLRMKIEDDAANPTKIVTVRGLGYKWNCGAEK